MPVDVCPVSSNKCASDDCGDELGMAYDADPDFELGWAILATMLIGLSDGDWSTGRGFHVAAACVVDVVNSRYGVFTDLALF